MYVAGRGVASDLIQAYVWFDVAAANGDQDAVRRRGLLDWELTKKEFAEASKLAREYSEKYRAK
jgi:TPR repeat protein